MAKKRNSSDAIERKLDALTNAVLAMMNRDGGGAAQNYRDFGTQSIFEYPSPQMFSDALAGDTVMEGAITDYAAQAAGGPSGLSREVASRAGDKYMKDVYRLIFNSIGQNMGKGTKGMVR